MAGPLAIGGAPVVTLQASSLPSTGPAFVSAEVLPGRGMMLLQARLRLPSGEVVDGLAAPTAAEAARQLAGGPEDFAGNKSFSFGGALLAPYANRITGRPLPGSREIETRVDGHPVRLPRNWGGKQPGARQYAMHGLILATRTPYAQPAADRVTGRLQASDFGGRWPGAAEIEVAWRLEGGALNLDVVVRNTAAVSLPLGLGWHPYFALPSGDRRQARLFLPADLRTEVNNYDEVLPTGRLLAVAGGPYDFSSPDGRALRELYLDDCFTSLVRLRGMASLEICDPAAGLGLRVTSPTPQVRAVQVYAPPDQAFVVVEPQFNLADPYSDVWPSGVDTGMARLSPGESLSYRVRAEPFACGNRPPT